MAQPSDQRALMLTGVRRLLFLSATPPPPAAVVARAAAPGKLPAPLAALSAGDPVLDRQIERVAMLVNSPISLLVTGETGSGKEYFAKAVHASSARKSRPFVAVNCAAIPETLIESELFGHLAGSFSGASARGKRGLIQQADGGTLFLDEIGDMPLALQARLLRVLSEHEVLPVGALQPVPVNIRVIAATHAPLEALVHARRFRDDLYYRLNGARFSLPPLRQRADLGATIDRMLGERTLTSAARERLVAYAWPGNLRELKNVLTYAASMRAEGVIDVQDLPELAQVADAFAPTPGHAAHAPAGAAPPPPADAVLLQALRLAHWNVSAVARQMGLSRMTLYRRMKRAGIVAPNRE
jgi:transcriptional regulator of acetoin/glycerol metabolism